MAVPDLPDCGYLVVQETPPANRRIPAPGTVVRPPAKIVMCGIPGSGHKLIREHLRRADYGSIPVEHGWNWRTNSVKPLAEVVLTNTGVAIVPQRDPATRRLSNERHNRLWAESAEYHAHHEKELDLLRRAGARILFVSLEAICRDKEVLDEAFRAAGLVPGPWPTKVYGEHFKSVPDLRHVSAERYTRAKSAGQ